MKLASPLEVDSLREGRYLSPFGPKEGAGKRDGF